MLLYGDNLVEISYATAQGILYVEPLNRTTLTAPEVKRIFTSTVICVREHDIKRLLVVFDKHDVVMSDTAYLSVLAQLAIGLLPASVEKIARVATKDPAREERMAAVYNRIREAVVLSLELRSFPSRAEALRWLMAK